jgi:hypothetical protein
VWLLSENLPSVPSGKIKRASVSELVEFVLAIWKKARKTGQRVFKKFSMTVRLIAQKMIWDNSDLDCPDLKINLEEPVDSECETGCTSEEDSE